MPERSGDTDLSTMSVTGVITAMSPAPSSASASSTIG
jgi:hypothetical protein